MTAGAMEEAPQREPHEQPTGSAAHRERYRSIIGHFATGVTVVTSIGDDGEPVGTTASAVTSLSLDPPLVLVCFDHASLTLRAIRAHGAFVVNVLAAPRNTLSPNFPLRALAAPWAAVRRRPAPTAARRLPAGARAPPRGPATARQTRARGR